MESTNLACTLQQSTQRVLVAFDRMTFADPSAVGRIEVISPMRKMGAVISFAEAIVFLLQSAYTTGTIFSVDGGFHAAW